LKWEESGREPHASCLRLHRALLAIRREEILRRRSRFAVTATGNDAVLLSYGEVEAAICLRGTAEVALPRSRSWRVLLSTEDGRFALGPAPPDLEPGRIRFGRPGALVLAPA